MRVLIIEDSAEVVETVSLCLQLRWPDAEVVVASMGLKGVELVQSEPFDIILLDINLPDTDGFAVLKQIREFSDVSTIILTVRGREEDQNKGLEIGADDYIVKPFRPRDLVARVNAVMRRANITKATRAQPYITRGKMSLDFASNEVRYGERTIKLTPTECRLLYVFMDNAEATLSSKKISQEVWGKEHSNTDPLRTYIRRLRNKLGDNPPQIILTEYGEGYKFIVPK